MCPRRRPPPIAWSLLLATLLGFAAAGEPAEARKKKAPKAETMEDLMVVDCLLPGQLRQLGRRATYQTARRPIRTTAIDCEIRGGEYVAFDHANYATALKVWLPLAEEGDAEAQANVGEIFEKGLAATPDHQAAARWYRKAAEQGLARAQINLGHLYEKGLGVDENKAEALAWYRRAAGIPEAIVLDTREQTEALRRQIESAQEEAARLAEELESSRAQVEELERRLEEARQAAETPAEEVSRLEGELESRQEELDSQKRSAESQQAKLAGYLEQLAAIDAGADLEVAGPSIEIVRPGVLPTRGTAPTLVPVPEGIETVEITGQVVAPAGVSRATADGEPLSLDARGFFELTVVCRKERLVELVAVDRRDQRVSTALLLQPGAPIDAGRPAAGAGSAPPRPRDRPAARSSQRRALVIGAASYQHLEDLATALDDAREVAAVLESTYGYQVELLENPSGFDILRKLQQLHEELGEDGRLILYYAGHGALGDTGEKGFWIPVDGERESPERWIQNGAISATLALMPAHHVLVISDSCYAGTLTGSAIARSAGGAPAGRLKDAVEGRRSRTVLTSGGLQPVLDRGGGRHSIFAEAFLSVLRASREPLSGTALHRAVAAAVTYRAAKLGVEQVPSYAPIHYAGHEGGDFVLVPVGAELEGSTSR